MKAQSAKRPSSGQMRADGSVITASFVPVDDLAHAASIIKSLRSSAISQKRYQRSAVRDDQIIQNLPQFNQLVSEIGAMCTEKVALEAHLEYAIALGNPTGVTKGTIPDIGFPIRHTITSATSTSAFSSVPVSSSATLAASAALVASSGAKTYGTTKPYDDDDDSFGGDDSDDDGLFDGFTAPKKIAANQPSSSSSASPRAATTARRKTGLGSPLAPVGKGAPASHRPANGNNRGCDKRWDGDDDDNDSEFGADDEDDDCYSRDKVASAGNGATGKLLLVGSDRGKCMRSGVGGTASSANSRVVMKPGQRPFVRAGGVGISRQNRGGGGGGAEVAGNSHSQNITALSSFN